MIILSLLSINTLFTLISLFLNFHPTSQLNLQTPLCHLSHFLDLYVLGGNWAPSSGLSSLSILRERIAMTGDAIYLKTFLKLELHFTLHLHILCVNIQWLTYLIHCMCRGLLKINMTQTNLTFHCPFPALC